MDINEPRWVDINVEGENTKIKYAGQFKLKPFLSHKEKADASRLAELYRKGIMDDWDQRTFLTLLAFLRFHVLETDAKWWKTETGLDLLDREPIVALGEKLNEAQGGKPLEKPEDATKA